MRNRMDYSHICIVCEGRFRGFIYQHTCWTCIKYWIQATYYKELL